MISYDTEGRYTQLENLTKSINHNAATTGILALDSELVVFFEDAIKNDLDILNVYKLKQLKNIVVVLTGVKGDTKFLMSLIIGVCEQWTNQQRDIVTAAYVSNIIADYIHGYTLRKNLRPLGGIILIGDTITGHIYRIGVDSAFDRNKLFVVGKNSKKVELLILEDLNKGITFDESRLLNHIAGTSDVAKQNIRIFKFPRTSFDDWVLPVLST